jgi:hypothetical protein
MFGFLKPACLGKDLFRQYRQVYAAFCAHHRQRYGVIPSAMISYEAVFLYLLAIETGACSSPASNTPTCCRLRSDPTNRWNLDRQLANFCSDFGMLLVGVKVDDDVRDSNSIGSRVASFLLERKSELARKRINEVCPGVIEQVDGLIAEHVRIENGTEVIGIEAYSRPTARSFGLIFAAFGEMCKQKSGRSVAWFELGEEVGRSVLVSDCCFDWERDRRRGEFNPIRNAAEKTHATSYALRSLSHLGWRCLEVERECKSGVLASVTMSAFNRVSELRFSSEKVPTAKLSLRSRLASRAGFCDCPCDCGGCDCGGCDGCDCGGADCGEGTDAGCLPCVDCCFCFGSDCGCPSSERRQKISRDDADIEIAEPKQMGIGITIGPLNPTGVVRIEDRDFPAKSQGGFVDDGVRVQVIGQEAFGVLVTPVDDQSKS